MSFSALHPEILASFGVFLACIGLVVWMIILERKPKDSFNTRLLPTTPIMLVSGFVALLALVHLVNVMGIHTGR
jgi:hypothetical protein